MAKSTYDDAEAYRVIQARANIMRRFGHLYSIMDYGRIEQCSFKSNDGQEGTMRVCPRVVDAATGTVDHDHFTIEYNPAFTKKLSPQQIEGGLKHEMLHIVLEHIKTRFPKGIESTDPTTGKKSYDMNKALAWNIAGDLGINQLIEADLKAGTEKVGVFPEDFKNHKSGCMKKAMTQKDFKCNCPTYKRGYFAEYYYKMLLKQMDEEQKTMKELLDALKRAGIQIDDHGQWSNQPGQQGKGQGQGQPKPGKGQGNSPMDKLAKEIAKEYGLARKKGKGDMKEDGEGQGEKEMKDFEGEGQGGGAMAGGGGAGDSSDTIDSIVFDRFAPAKKIPVWVESLKHSSTHGFDTDKYFTNKRPNRRFGEKYPAQRHTTIGNRVLEAIDVSGSIDMPLYECFMGHNNEMAKHADFDIIFFNTSIIGKPIHYEKQSLNVPIGGGTSFECVMQYWNDNHHKYDALYIFTDGCASYHTAPKRPKEVVWLIYGSASFQHGKQYHMEVG